MTCDHLEHLPDLYVTEYDDWYDPPLDLSHWEYNRTRDLTTDIDLHRFKCTRCGEIGYYSGAARQFYENGVCTPGIIGL